MIYYAFKHAERLRCIAVGREGYTLGEFLNSCKRLGIYYDYILASDLLGTDDEKNAVKEFETLERICSNGEDSKS